MKILVTYIMSMQSLRMIFIINYIALLFLFACSPPRHYYGTEDDIDVYKPEILDDGRPNVEGDFWEIAGSDQINLQQKAFVEMLKGERPFGDKNAYFYVEERIEGIGIIDLSALKGVSAIQPIGILEFYSTRLKDISILQEFVFLNKLTIRGSDVEDFSPISNLTKLVNLDIAYSKTKSLLALAGLTDLQYLTIDKESNFSLEPILPLMEKHLDSNGKMINLKVKYIENRLKEKPTTVRGNSMNAKVTPTLVGKYNVFFIHDYFTTDPDSQEFHKWL